MLQFLSSQTTTSLPPPHSTTIPPPGAHYGCAPPPDLHLPAHPAVSHVPPHQVKAPAKSPGHISPWGLTLQPPTLPSPTTQNTEPDHFDPPPPGQGREVGPNRPPNPGVMPKVRQDDRKDGPQHDAARDRGHVLLTLVRVPVKLPQTTTLPPPCMRGMVGGWGRVHGRDDLVWRHHERSTAGPLTNSASPRAPAPLF